MYELWLVVLAGCAMVALRGTLAITRLIVVTRGNLAAERQRGQTLIVLAAVDAMRAGSVHHGPNDTVESAEVHR
ncbi:hypothetical protein AB0I28_29745 [Phytomonospora sp. NPDC050363]|uniref:hypothetical protein n=1 Tax=Phytomonospora sp. NPDC050363 TaxID=3155642 RepID=UPI0033CE90EE